MILGIITSYGTSKGLNALDTKFNVSGTMGTPKAQSSSKPKFSDMSNDEAEKLAFDAIKGRNKSDAIVLGRFEYLKDSNGNPVLDANGRLIPTEKSYNIIAKDYDAQYFQIDNWDDIIKIYGEDQMWKINEKFLDIQTSSGREIYLSHDPNISTVKTTSFSIEIKYLKDNGYSFVKEGDLWHAIRW